MIVSSPSTVVAEDNAVERITASESVRITKAADRAKKLYPGPVGEFICRELTSMASMGFRFDQRGLAERTVVALLAAPLPE